MKKRCSKCGKTKPTTAFSKSHIKRDGLCVHCKACEAIYYRNWYKANREKRRAANTKYHKAHADRISERQAKYHKANPDIVSESKARYRKAHPDKVRDNHVLRRASKKGATVGKVERSVVYERDKGFCHICGVAVFHDDWHLDHLAPLSKGGEHSYRNVAVSHPGCNMKRGPRNNSSGGAILRGIYNIEYFED